MRRVALLMLLAACEPWADLEKNARCEDCGTGGGTGTAGGGSTGGGSAGGSAGASAGGSAGGSGGGSAGGNAGGSAGGSAGGGMFVDAGYCSADQQAPCRLPCIYSLTLITCTLPGSGTVARIASGRFDSDGLPDLALWQASNGGGLTRGVYWLRSHGDGGLTVLPVGPTSAGTAKLFTFSSPSRGPEDSVAALVGGTLTAWSPNLPDGGRVADGGRAQVLQASAIDAARMRLPMANDDGLVALNAATVDLTPSAALGDPRTFAVNVASMQWTRVEPWRDWLMLSEAPTDGHALTLFADGGRSNLTTSLVELDWRQSQEANLLEDNTTEFVMHGDDRYGVVDHDGGRPAQLSLTRNDLYRNDGGLVPLGNSFVVGLWGTNPATTLFTFPDAGGARIYSRFSRLTSTWEATDLSIASLTFASRFMQGVLVDLTGDGKNDLVVIDETGALRIYPGP